MSLGSYTFRSAALGVASAAALFAGSSAYAGDFTHSQCRLIAATTGEVIKDVGANKLSVEFRKSLLDFIMPSKNGAAREMTCDGPKDILTPEGNDIDAFNAIRQILYAGKNSISLTDAGLRSVDPKDIASSREQKRSELPAYRPGG